MKTILSILVSLCLLWAYNVWSMPCIESSTNLYVDYYEVEINGTIYKVNSVNDIFKADVECLPEGFTDIGITAVNSLGYSSPVYFTIYKEIAKNKVYYYIYPDGGYEQFFGENLFMIINSKAGKEVGGKHKK